MSADLIFATTACAKTPGRICTQCDSGTLKNPWIVFCPGYRRRIDDVIKKTYQSKCAREFTRAALADASALSDRRLALPAVPPPLRAADRWLKATRWPCGNNRSSGPRAAASAQTCNGWRPRRGRDRARSSSFIPSAANDSGACSVRRRTWCSNRPSGRSSTRPNARISPTAGSAMFSPRRMRITVAPAAGARVSVVRANPEWRSW